MTALYEKLFPRQYISKFLLNDLRQDSRPLTQYRPISIKSDVLPQCNASAEVSIGKTKLLCGLFYELGLPSIFAQRQGQVNITINTASLASNDIINQHPRERSEEGVVFTNLLYDLIKKQHLLDLSPLYISDKTVWHAYIDITIMSHDGNVWDAIIIAFQHVIKLTEMKYKNNIEHLPLTALLEREELYRARQAHEKELKSSQEGYISVLATLPPPNNNHINVPKLQFDLTQSKAQNGGSAIQGVGIFRPPTDELSTTSTITHLNTLDHPAPYPALLFPPIILKKTLYPTSIAVIPVQYVKPIPPTDDNGHEDDDDDDDDVKSSNATKTGLESLTHFDEAEVNSRSATNAVQATMPFTALAKQTRPYLLTRNVFVLDPTSSETSVADSIISIIFDQEGKICYTQKTSGATISPSALFKCMEVAAQHSGRVAKMINKYFLALEEQFAAQKQTIDEGSVLQPPSSHQPVSAVADKTSQKKTNTK